MSTFKLDYSNITADENLNKLRQSKHMGMKNLTVSNDFGVGKIKFSEGHVTTSDSKDPVIYFDDQVNILQSAYTDDQDVINTDKNTSFVDYRNLSKTYYTKIGGSQNEYIYKNNKCIDKDNNLYVVFDSGSDLVNIYDSTNNDVPVADLVTSTDPSDIGTVIVKYNHLGEFQWSTHIGGYYAKYYPSLVCDNDGNVIVSFGNDNDGDNNVLIYDTTDNYNPVSTITDAADYSSIIVKYDTNGVFQWTVHVDGVYDGGSDVLPRISCDVSGNVFLANTLLARQLKIYDKTPEEYIPHPDDFFCVVIDHFHTGHTRFSQPIFTYNTGLSNYNYVTIKFDKEGKLKWVNHVELTGGSDYDPQCFIDNDIDGNVILTGNFSEGNLNVWNPLNTALVVPDATLAISEDSYGNDNIFIIKFDPNGSVIWCTKVAADDDDVTHVNTITDSEDNIYCTFRSRDNRTYLFDTTNTTSPVKTINAKEGNRGLLLVKYNKDGVLVWSTIVDGYSSKYDPCVVIDNRYIKGSENSNIYLVGEYYGNINFYNSNNESYIAYTLPYDVINDSSHGFISCFDQDGKFSWATRALSSATNDEDYAYVFNLAVAADKDGHVYLMGCYEYQLNIYDAQNNDKPVATLTKANSETYQADIFIIKYNRYGLLNTSNPKLLYIEDNSDLPDSFCKEVILTNNDHNGIVNLQILHRENYGYSVRRNVLITEAIELITKDGIWIPKIIADQYEYVNDLDVIDTNTKTSFVNYQNLQNTFYTRIGGGGNDLNPQMYLDKHDNVYLAGVYESSELGIYDFTNNTVPVGSLLLDGDQSLFLTKYDQSGVNKWYTRIGGYETKSEPSVFVNGNGDLFITMQSSDDGDVNFYDVNNQQNPVKTLSGTNSGESYTIFVKYNNKGEFQWNIRVIALIGESDSFTSTAVVTGDLEGNLIISGYFDGDSILVLDTGDDEVPVKVFTRSGDGGPGAYFILKFDYTGKFLWVNHLEGGLIPNNQIFDLYPDLFKIIQTNLNTDSYGNIFLTSTFYIAVTVYNPNSTAPVASLFTEEGFNIGLFSIKYNSSGEYIWHNSISSNADFEFEMFSGIIESSSCVDADGNLYVSFSNRYVFDYSIFDTRVVSQPVYVFSNDEFLNDSFVSIVKFNHDGIYQWNNVINAGEIESGDDLVFRPVITCDNNYLIGQYNPNIYVHFNGYVDNYRGGFNFYNASSITVLPSPIAYTLPSKDYWMGETTTHSILCKYDSNGNFQWATTAAGYSSQFDISAVNVQVDRSGHVYISGSYYDEDTLYIWDVSTNGIDDDEVGYLDNINNFDCFLIKYNRYGLINGNNTHPDIYLEDVPNIPNAFEKSIVITHNTNNGPVNCHIMEKVASGYGYNFRKTITLTDSLDLVSNNGIWIPKIQAEQISISSEVDVIDLNTKLSMLNYDDLNYLSWSTTISGDGNEQNLRLSCDKNDNIYAVCSFDSDNLQAYYYFNSNYEILNRYSTSRDVAIIKYLSNGVIDWATKIGFDDTFTGSPSIYTDAEGNSYVTVVKTSSGGFSNLYIFDTRNNSSIYKTVTLTSNGASLIKYDKDGVYLWDIRINAHFTDGFGTYGTKAVADKNGNVYMAGFIIDSSGVKIIDTSDSVMDELGGSDGMFIVKFDKTGKYVWSIPLYSGINTDAFLSIVCDQEGNVTISGTQFDTITVYNRIGNAIRNYGDINRISVSTTNIFMVKYDTDGKCLWTNRLGSSNSGESYLPSSAVDSYGNYYLAVQMAGTDAYIFDTRNVDDVRYTIPIPTNGTENTFFAKYNKNGIVQWYNFVSGYSTTPNICVDNRFVRGNNRNSVYLNGSFSGTGEPGIITIYNSGSNGGWPYSTSTLTTNNFDSFLIKFFDDGYLDWCSKVSGSDESAENSSVVATNDGHVYFGGEFNSDFINVYQGSTLTMNPNDDIALTINNESESNTYDIFLIKYNRYGTVNNGDYRFGREIYLENNDSIPDGTEKTIVIRNNGESNGFRENVCLIILQFNNPGYYSFRNLWFSEGVSLISYGGQWFVKSSSNDVLPKRSIIMWGGNQTNIPLGWRLCDGGSLNGVSTPDLRGRFVLGYNPDLSVTNGTSVSGGNTNIGTGARVGTNLSGTVGSVGGEVLHTLTNYEMPIHNHGGNTGEAGFGSSTVDAAVSLTTNPAVYGSGTHSHSISNDGGGQPHNVIPPFYVLAYIMKCF